MKKNVSGAVMSPKPDSNTKNIKPCKRTGKLPLKTRASLGFISKVEAKAEAFPMVISAQQKKTQVSTVCEESAHSKRAKTSNFCSTEANVIELHNSDTLPEVHPVKRQKIAMEALKVESEQTLQHRTKLKLQLFPIDERTRERLEKDKCNPHLELTLSARKKIISVLKHLNSKWGNSNAALGELMLFPYDIDLRNLAKCKRWTSNDVETTAADVYGIIGRPAVFRLRYGWFSNPLHRLFEEPLTSSSVKDPLQLEVLDKEYKNVHISGVEIQPSKEPLPGPTSDLSDSKEGGNETVDEEENQRSDAATMSMNAWADCLSNISMGSLFMDVSRFGLMAVKGDSHLRQASFNSDSFDAAIAAHLDRHQSPIFSTQVVPTSILDAEETCQGFLFQKIESLRENVKPELQLVQHLGCPDEPADNSQTNQTCQDDVVNNIGNTDLSWSCSLGPCDLGQLSSSRQIINGDSISLGGLLATSLDAIQNYPLHSKDVVPTA
ncbi:TSL-kinase interacting protein 1-like isoform X2 [Aristolochia californica]|uniref:TSL-kinase interacting protein 1-like isoform X2 n=1 Tax=Aristolochia californica TaxID=171875 RepID=UPI0035D87505